MPEEPKGGKKWTAAERAALRKLLRMAVIMLLAIVVAGDAGRAVQLLSGYAVTPAW